jgi:predicted transcriptional regulator
MGDLSELELQILRYMHMAGGQHKPSEIAPNLGLSLQEATDRLNELEWVGYVEEREGVDGAESIFTLTSDGADAATLS